MYSHKAKLAITDHRQVAWLAGLLEGEGSFIKRGNSIAISLQMTDLDIVERVAALTNSKVHEIAPVKEHHKKSYALRIDGARAAYYMEQVLPYMGARRTQKIIECLTYFGERLSARLDSIGSNHHKVSDADLIASWNSKDPSVSLRKFARSLSVNHETLRKRLTKLGLYTPAKLSSRLVRQIENISLKDRLSNLNQAL